jgi:hypothetical protein
VERCDCQWYSECRKQRGELPEGEQCVEGITKADVERAKSYYDAYQAPEPSLTMRVLRGEFGQGSIDYLILRKARKYAIDREHSLSQPERPA